jgi:tetratricopeptide (TPR) repeat protein
VFAALVPLLLLLQTQSPVERAKTLIEAGKLTEARQALAAADPAQPDAAYLAGLLHYRAREYPAAIESLKRAVEAPPASVTYKEAVQMLGLSYYLSGHLKDAIPWLERSAQTGARLHPVGGGRQGACCLRPHVRRGARFRRRARARRADDGAAGIRKSGH